MSLEKAIKYGKEWRKQYRDSRLFSWGCRNHGSCKCCEGNRLYASKKRLMKAMYDEKEVLQEVA
jgi:hypothetical protein